MRYFDAHCHVQFGSFDADRKEVLHKMHEAEVGALVVGVDLASSQKAIELVKAQAELFAAVGLHPNDTAEPYNQEAFEELAQQPKVVAIGECGLDYYRPSEPESVKKIQKEIFEHQIELAVKYEKPLVIHARPSKGTQDAYHDTIAMLISKKREHGNKLRGDMHFFVGGIEEARQFVNLGFTMSYTAVLTFAREYDEVVRFLPLANLLSETDSPYVAPAPNRGKRNEPTAVRNVVKAIAEIRGIDEETIRQSLLENSANLFGFSV